MGELFTSIYLLLGIPILNTNTPQILFACLTVIVGIMGSNGGTRHLDYLSNDQAVFVTRLNWIGQPFGIVAIGTGKLAVGLLILRLLNISSKWRKYGIWALMILVSIVTALTVVLTFVQCENPEALWNPPIRKTTRCWDPHVQTSFSTFAGSLHSATDFILALIPITIIWDLQLSVRKRISLILLLGAGVFSGVCSAIKTDQLNSLTSRSDLTWETFSLYLWTGAEIFLVIVCGSLPTLKPLWDRCFGRILTSATGSRNSRGYASYRSKGASFPRQARGFELSSVAHSSRGPGDTTEATCIVDHQRETVLPSVGGTP